MQIVAENKEHFSTFMATKRLSIERMTTDHIMKRLEGAFQSDPRVELFETTFIMTVFSPLDVLLEA